ncbi:MAG: oligosaccharide flippase family protein, partial [Chloroflexota bacterium]
MKSFLDNIHAWSKDFLLRKVVRNSAFLFGGQAMSAVLSILTADMLGVAGFGVLGVVVSFISNINRLMSFRMGDFVVKYMGAAIARDENDSAAAIIKVAALTETLTSILAFVILLLLAPWAADKFAKDPTTTILFQVYGLTILGNIASETATGVLQVTGHFRSQALINLVQSFITAGLILLVYITKGDVLGVVLAYLAGKILLGVGPMVLAAYWLHKVLGKSWWRVQLRDALPPRKEMVRFALSSNFSGTINILARDSEVLWVSYFFSTVEAGYFKVALAVINLMVMPI